VDDFSTYLNENCQAHSHFQGGWAFLLVTKRSVQQSAFSGQLKNNHYTMRTKQIDPMGGNGA